MSVRYERVEVTKALVVYCYADEHNTILYLYLIIWISFYTCYVALYMGFSKNTCKSFILSPPPFNELFWHESNTNQHLQTILGRFRKVMSRFMADFGVVCQRLCSICMKLLLKMYFMLFEKLFLARDPQFSVVKSREKEFTLTCTCERAVPPSLYDALCQQTQN